MKIHKRIPRSCDLGDLLHECWYEDLPSPIECDKRWGTHFAIKHRVEERGNIPAHTSVDEYRRPAHYGTIMSHLLRLSMHKHIKGEEKQKAFLLKDYTQRLGEMKVLEVDLFFAIDHFIADDDGEFFPSFAKLKKALRQ